MRSVLAAAALIAAGSLASTANAAVIVSSADVGPGLQTTEINQTLTLQKFDTQLGMLVGASLTLSAAAESILSLTNNSAQTQRARANATIDLNFNSSGLQGIAALDTLLGPNNPIVSFGFATGTQMLAAGGTYTSPLLSDAGSMSFDLASMFEDLSSSGAEAFTVGCNSLSGLSVIGGGGNVATTQSTQAGCSARIEYTYEPVTRVPAPAAGALLGLALAGAALRRCA